MKITPLLRAKILPYSERKSSGEKPPDRRWKPWKTIIICNKKPIAAILLDDFILLNNSDFFLSSNKNSDFLELLINSLLEDRIFDSQIAIQKITVAGMKLIMLLLIISLQFAIKFNSLIKGIHLRKVLSQKSGSPLCFT